MGFTDDEMWKATVDCRGNYDGQFFYAVKTVGVYCRPSCKSRTPLRKNVTYFETQEEAETASSVFFCGEKVFADHGVAETPLIQKAASQLTEYFAGERKEFDLPLALEGTKFQMAAWKALQAIPSGETRSYKDIAKTVGKPQAGRAVGMANNKNPILIIVPCHRVIGQDGSLVGYAAGIPAKEYLLGLEKHHA